MQTYTIEVTDTFGGEANYSWVKRYLVTANTQRGAILKLSRHYGGEWRNAYHAGDISRYDMKGACICCFMEFVDLDGWSDLGGVYYEKI